MPAFRRFKDQPYSDYPELPSFGTPSATCSEDRETAMRTYFELEDTDAFEAAKALLIRRCAAWAEHEDVDPVALEAALEFRHYSVDGRLGYWTTGLVEEFLLSHTPRTLSATPEDSAHVPEGLRLLLRYLHATGLADPTGDPLADLEAAVTKAGAEFAAAMADERNFGVSKFWVMNAFRHGIDPADETAMESFVNEVREGRVDYDDEVLSEIAARHVLAGDSRPERAMAQLPVSLPPDAELAAAAEQTPVVTWLRTLVEWAGNGRALTPTGNLKLADARELVTLLDTGDELDPRIGDRTYRTQSSADLPVLASLVELAKKIRVVRVIKGKLVRVEKNARLLREGLALWTAAFDALPSSDLVRRGRGWVPEYTFMLGSIIDEVLPDVLNTLYSFPEPIPVVRLEESVWLSFGEAFYLDELDETTETAWREGVLADLRRLFTTLADFGAVKLTTGDPDPIFGADLGRDGPDVFPPDAADRLRSALSAGAVDLMTLTPLAARAVRTRLVEAGRHAPLVGELSNAEPAGLLGALTEHYTPETAEAELAGWLDTHGGLERGLSLLLDAIRNCPFRSRAGATLDVLTQAIPDGSTFLRGLRQDRQLGPIVVQILVGNGELAVEELSDEERLCAMAEQFILLLEVGGPDAIADALAAIPPDEARSLTAELLACGHPNEPGIAELREIFTKRRSGLATVHPLAGMPRPSRKVRGKRKSR
ncbi:hypothetical protein AB0383_17815 [Amycolatopsis sp. NPDC051373]|uniref:hypothetical protein n=1 Tax=Amycolatopsis sp. NPDC051373 TaxID=3155801 RepID=UPI00344D1314